MKVRVEFLLTHEHAIYDVGRIPCIGEDVIAVLDGDGECHEVKEVIHVLNADSAVQAIVRVK